ncbi:uncharacterized protein K02A2.6-like [Bufo bufo]|uniref:uncharacterized protein K02A2.6-like n=1 Tax=Bufo bufo TaxID=8384 RepID=UPI001ABE892A|nr:uncharacterized protein K02A2.6-like [Bufo bufo]
MAFIGFIQPFDPAAESWISWVERLEQYMEANNVTVEKKVAVFLTALGQAAYGTLRDLVSPDKPASKSLPELIQTLHTHYNPKPLEIAERFKFYSRRQQAGEDIKTYIIALRKLAATCQFGDYLQTALRDMFVMGLCDPAIQKRLLTEPDLTLTKATDLATVMELATRDATLLKAPPTTPASQCEEIFHTAITQRSRRPSPATQLKPRHPNSSVSGTPTCYRCGNTTHSAPACKFKDVVCFRCGKTGHIGRVCRSSRSPNTTTKDRRKQTFRVDMDNNGFSSDEETCVQHVGLFQVAGSTPAIKVDVTLNGCPVSMDVDTGAAVSVISWTDLKASGLSLPLKPTKLTLQTYSKELLQPLGYVKPLVTLGNRSQSRRLYVVRNGGPPLYGRDWIKALGMPPFTIAQCTLLSKVDHWVESLKSRFNEVFEDSLGTVKGKMAHLLLKPGATPRFCKARSVPFALRKKVEAELDHLLAEKIITKVDRSEWASPIVPVKKKNGDIRICGDFRVALNNQLLVDQYPLPRLEDLFGSLAGGQKFTKIDLKQAYLQLQVHPDSRHLLTINTHKGLFQYNRMVFGIAPAPAIWQRIMDEVLAGIPFTQCLLDDMLITGPTDEEHRKNVEAVLERLQKYGLRVNLSKCEFLKSQLEFCAHTVDRHGLHTTEEKVKALTHAPTPRNVTQLRSYLGLLNYYHRFLPNLAHQLYPLHRLLDARAKWIWTDKCEEAFRLSKELILSSRVLVHYDLKKPVILACDASPYGLGAVLSHVMPDGTERPISFASRSLTSAEQNYSQIDKEALAIVWATKKFHAYIYGREFTLITDHKPLLSILNPQKGISTTTASRLQRYALFLGAYAYSIRYRSHDTHGNADAFSRLPLRDDHPLREVRVVEVHRPQSCMSTSLIARHTATDPFLSQIFSYVQTGWPERVSGEFRPYFARKCELVTNAGCLQWGNRVIVPQYLQSTMLRILHEGHPGVVRMKQRARSYVWWPQMDTAIEDYVAQCPGCCQAQRPQKRGTLQPWPWPTEPWSRLHLDFAGPIQGKMYLIVVDAHSKWPEVFQMPSITSAATILVLRKLFAQYGLPTAIVSDNGTQFTSHEFQSFLSGLGVQHYKTAPYHPASNGLAERFVQTFKKHLLSTLDQVGLSEEKLLEFLIMYRNTKHATTGLSPAFLMFGRHLRTKLDLVRPQEQSPTPPPPGRLGFRAGDLVWSRNYRALPPWLPGVIDGTFGRRMYLVRLEEGICVRRHLSQLRKRICRPLVTKPTPLSNHPPESTLNSAGDIWHGVWHDPTSLQPNPEPVGDQIPEEPGHVPGVTETDLSVGRPLTSPEPLTDSIPPGAVPLRKSTRQRRQTPRWQSAEILRDTLEVREQRQRAHEVLRKSQN